jgi:hypothetical protein
VGTQTWPSLTTTARRSPDGVSSSIAVPAPNRDVWRWSGVVIYLAAPTDAQWLAALAKYNGDKRRDCDSSHIDDPAGRRGPFLLVELSITVFAASIGVWLFYVQHQFEGTC